MQTEIWELDFYSRPVLDGDGKKIWELLICDRLRQKEWAQTCPASQVNSDWIAQQLTQVIQEWGQSPQKVRFYRPAMHNMLVRACKLAQINGVASRRLAVIPRWLEERMVEVYPTWTNFQGQVPDPLPLTLNQPPALKPLPDALRGDRWIFAFLAKPELENLPSWSIDFGELLPLDLGSQADTIPGVMIFSSRAGAIGAWMSGIDPVSLECQQDQLVLNANADALWSISRIKDLPSAQKFQLLKTQTGGLHFLGIQTHPEQEALAGFWLLRSV